MDATEFILVFGSVLLPLLIGFYAIRRWFNMKERRIEIEAQAAAEKAAQYAVQSKEFERRLEVLERIVTDNNPVLAQEIDALRALPDRDVSVDQLAEKDQVR